LQAFRIAPFCFKLAFWRRTNMGVCALVKEFAEAVSQVKQPREPQHRLAIEILRLMPLYRESRCLDSWENAFPNSIDSKEGEIDKLLNEIFEFGRCNLYSAFVVDRTIREMEALIDLLRCSGVDVQSGDVSDW
jgi:hypothetical protein